VINAETVKAAMLEAAAMRPYRGHVAVSPEGFKTLRDVVAQTSVEEQGLDTPWGRAAMMADSVDVMLDPKLGDDVIEVRPAPELE
jgi:hypothetical protein